MADTNTERRKLFADWQAFEEKAAGAGSSPT